MLPPMEVVLRLRAPGELFATPDRSPLDDDYELWCINPGVEHLAQVVRDDHPKGPLQVVVELPEQAVGPTADRVKAGVARYCAARAEELMREIRGATRRALWSLIPTGSVFAVPVLLSRLAESARDNWLSTTVSEALVVIGWVVLWSPVAILGTEIWGLRGRRSAYLRLAGLDLDLRSPG